jgi:hypothetical protein
MVLALGEQFAGLFRIKTVEVRVEEFADIRRAVPLLECVRWTRHRLADAESPEKTL